MNLVLLVLIMISIILSSTAQLLLKLGASSVAIKLALATGEIGQVSWAAATNFGILGGLAAFGLSVIVWLVVLSRIDVSYAYPFVALGIVFTALSGRFLLGEDLSPLRIAGLVIIVVGVVVVAASAPATR